MENSTVRVVKACVHAGLTAVHEKQACLTSRRMPRSALILCHASCEDSDHNETAVLFYEIVRRFIGWVDRKR